MVGEFKDDRVQSHDHGMYSSQASTDGSGAFSGLAKNGVGFHNFGDTNSMNGRKGDTTRGKRKGVKYIIKVL